VALTRGGRFIALLVLLLLTPLYATQLHLDQRSSYWLSTYSDYYEDAEGHLTLKDVQSREFVKDDSKEHNFGFTTSTYWFRATVDPSGTKRAQDWWLRVYYPLLDDIRVYGVDTQSGQLLFEKRSGDLQPYGEREVAHLNFLFQIPLESRPITLYVRVTTESSMQVPMMLQTSRAVMEEDQRTILLTGLYYGLFIVIFLYNVIMYYYTRERTYLLYLFFITTFVLWQMTLNGIAQEYLWPDWLWIAEHGAPFFTALSAMTAILFSQHFLQTARFIPRMDNLLKVLMLYSVVAVVLSLFLTYRTSMLMSVGLAIMVPILLLISGTLVWKNKFRPARFYVFGWSSFLLGTVVIALNKYGIFHGYLFFNHAQQLGSALEMIFLSWALADRIKLMQDEYVDKLSTLNVVLQQKVAAGLEKQREKDRMLIRQSRLAAMGEMIEQIAHQWRQPLNTMALIMQDLFFKFKLNTLTTDTFDRANEQINETLQYMSKTIDDFRNFHQLDKETDAIAVEEVINMAMTLNEASLKYAHIECAIHSEHPHYAIIAKNELVQVFMNLLKNARDAIAEERSSNGRIDISIDENTEEVRVIIEDNGGGISEVIMDHIFDPYFTTKQPAKGTGLGLYMSYGIIESMHGSLRAENGDHGARFIITLPKKRLDEI
jgi:signal transduction histidine kinase